MNTTQINTSNIMRTFHAPVSSKKLDTFLKKINIDKNSLPESIQANIGFMENANFLRKTTGTFKFTGMVALLGDGSSQTMVRNTKDNGIISFNLGPCDVFNPEALDQEKTVIIVPSLIGALKLSSLGLNAISIGSSCPLRYLIARIDEKLIRGEVLPPMLYLLPEKVGHKLDKDLELRCIRHANVLDATLWSKYSNNQKAIFNEILESDDFNPENYDFNRKKAA